MTCADLSCAVIPVFFATVDSRNIFSWAENHITLNVNYDYSGKAKIFAEALLNIVILIIIIISYFCQSGEVQGELPDDGWGEHGGQTSEDPQGGVDSGEPPLLQIL